MTLQEVNDLFDNAIINDALAEAAEQHEKDIQVLEDYLDDAEADVWTLLTTLNVRNGELEAQRKKLGWQRAQLRNYEWKLAAMKTWAGMARTLGQKLGFCR